MNHENQKLDLQTILVKNLPKTLQDHNEYFRHNYKAIATRSYGRQRIILKFPNETTARIALQQLHQCNIDNNILSAEYFRKGKKLLKSNHDDSADHKNAHPEIVPDFVKKLYAISSAHGFNEPPSPNLKYSYPKINRDILDSISIALMSNTKFYTQVLHLMNRMNLEPPFLARKHKFIQPSELRHISTQTDFNRGLLASDESELEMEDTVTRQLVKRKRRFNDTNLIKEKVKLKARKLLDSKIQTNIEQQKSLVNNTVTVRDHQHHEDIAMVFEQNDKLSITGQKIAMNVAMLKLPTKVDISSTQGTEEIEIEKSNFNEDLKVCKLKIEDLKMNRIPENQLKELSVFKNYIKGERTNKLYIKNLHKDVTTNDLENIYQLFVIDNNTNIENLSIKLMQHGRMKGQAFVEFLNVNETNMALIDQALSETNGYILKTKPMVVCFGKKS